MSAQGSVPKFSSFKPKPPVVTEEVVKIHKSVENASHDKERRHHRKRRRSRSRERSPERHEVKDAKPLLHIKPVEPVGTSYFVVDRKGDPKNLIFGGIHRYDIPLFRRAGAGNVLGAKRAFKIDRIHGEENSIILSDQRYGFNGKREKYAFARNEKNAPRLLRIRPQSAVDDPAAKNTDFVPLRSSKKHKRSANETGSDSDDGRDHYRSIEGKAKAGKDPIDKALEYATDSEASESESGRIIRLDESTRRETIKLSRQVEDHPKDLEVWLELISHQDRLLGLGDGGRRKITSAERSSTAEIKVHLYEKALEKAGSSLANRERLLLGLMTEGAKIWSFKVQSDRWEQISKDHIQSTVIWKAYMDFRQTSFPSFKYEEALEIYKQRIHLLRQILDKDETPETCTEQLCYTILRATLLMREAGYTELAVAVWQGLLEFNFFADESSSRSDRLEKSKDFWESEVPRIGENNAKGFKISSNEDQLPPQSHVDSETPAEYLLSRDIFAGWASAEEFRASASKSPARMMDEVTEDDPYRVILWSDIESFIIDTNASGSAPTIHSTLLDTFLIFCGLPPLPPVYSWVTLPKQWLTDPFICGENLVCNASSTICLYPSIQNSVSQSVLGGELPVIGDDVKSQDGRSPYLQCFQGFVGSVESLFSGEQWAKYFNSWKSMYGTSSKAAQRRLESGPVDYQWLRNTLKSLVGAETSDARRERPLSFLPGDRLAEYYLAFEWCNEPEDIKKTAKSLIKQRPKSLRLYNAYATIEWLRGNREIVSGVISAALGMRDSLSEIEGVALIQLWRTKAWCLLDDGDKDGALACLLSISDGKMSSSIDISSPAALLKAKQYLSSARDRLLSSRELYYSMIYAECVILLEYTSSNTDGSISKTQGDITAALIPFTNFTTALASRGLENSVFNELLHQSFTRLFHHHIRRGPFQPSTLRAYLTSSLSLFPQNTILLSLYTWNESRLRLHDRVRTILRDLVLMPANDNPTSRLFAIRHEMQVGTVHSVYASFESATTNASCSNNASVWCLWVLFCVRNREYKGRAKDVFYAGMRACPWAKGLLMLAFTELRGVLGWEGCKQVYRVLGEKQLRIHVDLEDRLEEAEGQKDLARR